MKHPRNLMLTVLIIGTLIALLSYLFHPEANQFSMTYNGQPIADPVIRLAALPTLFIVFALTGLLAFMLFFGFGVVLFLGGVLMALLITLMVAPYFWPFLVIIALMLALSSFHDDPKAPG